MQEKNSDGHDRKSARGRLIAFGVCILVVGLFLAALVTMGDYIVPLMIKQRWQSDFDAGEKLLSTDPDKAKQSIDKAFTEAAPASVATRMGLHQRYANDLYDMGQYDEGDKQIDEAIKLFPGKPNAPTEEANVLTHAYQDRAWAHHRWFLQDSLQDPGTKDQEMSVAVAESAFGPDHEQTIFKLAGLAVIYADLGDRQKSQAIFDRIIKTADTNASAKPAAWFVYASLARTRALEQDYAGAAQAFLHARTLCHDRTQINRVTDELTDGLERNKQSDKDVEAVPALLSQGKYAELDKLADNWRHSKQAMAAGDWKLDRLYAKLAPKNERSEEYTQILYELKKWLSQFPHSATARVALADCYINYAWQARGGGYGDSVSEQGWRLFRDRLQQARATLDGDPSLKQRCPLAFTEYAVLALGQDVEKPKFMALVNECHQLWPTYRTIDYRACIYLLPRWYGNDGEVENFIKARADSVGGDEGDELYAQLVCETDNYSSEVFGKRSLISWPRIKSGFKKIFADYPEARKMRANFVKQAAAAHDLDSIQVMFARPNH